MIQRVGQIHVSVTDIDRAVAFYRDVLELPLLFEVPGQDMAFFDCDGVRLYLGKAESPEFKSQALIYYAVRGIEKAHETLAGRGVEFLSEPHVVHAAGGTELVLAFFRDSEGNLLALMEERPTPSAA